MEQWAGDLHLEKELTSITRVFGGNMEFDEDAMDGTMKVERGSRRYSWRYKEMASKMSLKIVLPGIAP